MQELENNSLCINIKEESEQEKVSRNEKKEIREINLNIDDVDDYNIGKFDSKLKRKYIPTDCNINENESKSKINPTIRLKNKIFTEINNSFLNQKNNNIISNGNIINQKKIQTEENIKNNNINKLYIPKYNFHNLMKTIKPKNNYPYNLRNKRFYSNNIKNNNNKNKSLEERIIIDTDNEVNNIHNKNFGINASNKQIQQKQNINRDNSIHKTKFKNIDLRSPSNNINLNSFLKNINEKDNISLSSEKKIEKDSKEKNDKFEYNIEIKNNLNNSQHNKYQIDIENNENKREFESNKIKLNKDESKDKNKINYNLNSFLPKDNIKSKEHNILIKNINDFQKRPKSQSLRHKTENKINNLIKNKSQLLNEDKFNHNDIDISLKNKEESENKKEQKNENHKYEKIEERKSQQLKYIKSRPQIENTFPKNINKMNEASLSSGKIKKVDIKEKNDEFGYNVEIKNNLNNLKNNKYQINIGNNENKKEFENYKIELKTKEDNDNDKDNYIKKNINKKDELENKNNMNYNNDTLVKNINDFHKRPKSQSLRHKNENKNNNLKNNQIQFINEDKFNHNDNNLKNKEELEDKKELKNENHKYEKIESKKGEQLGYIKFKSQIENIFSKKDNKRNDISLSSGKIKKEDTKEKNINNNLKIEKEAKNIKTDFEDQKSIENNNNTKHPNKQKNNLNYRHFHKLFKNNETIENNINEKSKDEINSKHNLKNKNDTKFLKQFDNLEEKHKEKIENNSEINGSNKLIKNNKIENIFDNKKIKLNDSQNKKYQLDIENNGNRKEFESYKIELKYPEDNDNKFKKDNKKKEEIKDKDKMNFNINYLQEKNIINLKHDDILIKIKDDNNKKPNSLNSQENKIKHKKLKNNNKIEFINDNKFNQKNTNKNPKNYVESEDEKEPNNMNLEYQESEERMLEHLKSESKIGLNVDKNYLPNKANLKNSVLSNIKGSTNLFMDNPLVIQLIELGTESKYAQRIYQFLHPNDIDEALDYLSSINGIIQHDFIHDRNINNKNCYLCGEEPGKHLGWKEKSRRSTFLDDEKNLKKSEKTILCDICQEDFVPNENNTVAKCKHSYCNDCWYDFISVNIKENKLNAIKCLNHECSEKISDEFIFNVIKNDEVLIRKYKRYKLELQIINDPNKKLCPYPNCDSYLELVDNKIQEAKCKNNHKFCFLCLKEPHGKLSCEANLDDSIIEYGKKNFIKKCPKCQIITEKNGGCNHMTCNKCQYQWCWLCNQEYKIGHFDSGKCKGLQFFKPKDDYEIKLAQEGKIKLRGSEIQPDFENDFGLDFIENRRIEGENNNNNIVHDNKLKKVKLIIIYIFFGFLILSFILGFNMKPNVRKRYLILFYLYFLLFGLIYYFIIFTLNIIMLAPLIIICGFTKFIDNCEDACDKVDYFF